MDDTEEVEFGTKKTQESSSGKGFNKVGSEEDEEQKEEKQSMFEWFVSLKARFGCPVLSLMFYLYFFQGFKVFLRLTTKDYFKHYLKLEPNEAQFYSSIMDIPWIFKMFYGIFADNVSIFGSH